MSVRPLGFKLSEDQRKLVVDNLNLARREAWRFQRRTEMPYDDLEAVAFIGLMKACHRFEPELGWKLSTYCVPKIRGELLHYVRDHSYLLRLSHRMRENWVKGRRLLDRGNTDQQVADGLGLSIEEWLDTRQACSGAPLELKDNASCSDTQLEAREDDRLTRLEAAARKAWTRIGVPFAKNLAANHRFDHLLREHAAETMVALTEAIFDGRDLCVLDMGTPIEMSKKELRAVSVASDNEGVVVVHAGDLGNGRLQRSLFE